MRPARPAWKRRLDRLALWLAHHLWIVRWHAPKRDEQEILRALAAAERELYGLDLVAAGAATRDSLYVVLARMEDRGLIEGREENGVDLPRLPRRLYRITDVGRAALLPDLPPAKVR